MTTVLLPTGTGSGAPAGTIDWPSTPELRPSAMRIGLRPARSSWQAVYTRQRTSVSHLADRLAVTLSFPPCASSAIGVREAFLAYLADANPWVRLHHHARPYPAGTLRGAPTVYAAAAAGLRTVTLTDLRSGPNLLLRPQGFGYSPWVLTNASVTANATTAPDGALTADALLRTATGNHYIAQSYGAADVSGQTYTFSVYLKAGTLTGDVAVVFRNQAGTQTPGSTTVTPSGSWQRVTATGTFTAGAGSNVIAFVDPLNDSGSAGDSLYLWGAQLERAAAATDYAGPATLAGGDLIGAAGALMMVGYGGAVETDAGLMTVPLALPLRTALEASDAVTWDKPTGTFQIESVADLQYTAGIVQEGFELTFLEVV